MDLRRGLLFGAIPSLSLIVACGSVDATTSTTNSSSTSTSTSESTSTSSASSSAATGSGGAGGSDATSTGAGGASSSASTGTGAPTPPLCATDLAAGHHAFKCDGGITYDVDIPPACASGGCGLVLDMHGFTMSADLENKGTQMQALGQKHGYVVVQPTAPGLPSSWDQATHAPLVFTFVKELAAALAADSKRIHVMGFSQGGGMTWRLLCAHADYFASAAPIGGLAGCEFTGANTPSQEIPILQVHGRKDAVVNFQSVALPQRDLALKHWSYGPGAVIEEDAMHTATRYTTAAGTRYELWEHDYVAGSFILGGHCFPGGTDAGVSPFQFGCTAPGTFIYGELAMQFFLDHPRP